VTPRPDVLPTDVGACHGASGSYSLLLIDFVDQPPFLRRDDRTVGLGKQLMKGSQASITDTYVCGVETKGWVCEYMNCSALLPSSDCIDAASAMAPLGVATTTDVCG